MKRYRPYIIIILLLISPCMMAKDTWNNAVFQGVKPLENKAYRLRLINGDICTGISLGKGIDALRENGSIEESIVLKTLSNVDTIYADDIAEISILEDSYRFDSQLFLMPTANPIKSNHSLQITELCFAQAHIGWDRFSVIAGASLIPGITWQEQVKLLNVKATIYQENNVDMPGRYAFATGINLGFANSNNAIQHIYAVGSFTMERTTLTTTAFYKVGVSDIYEAKASSFGSTLISMPNGTLGFGIGFDTRLSDRHETRAIAELWCLDLLKPRNSAAFIGIRLHSSVYAADFGLSLFSAPFIIPACSFKWMPF